MSAFDLQKESDVKEYLEKLGIEYRFGCYSEKKAEACHLLGDYFESIKKDFEKASKVYRSNCDDYGYGRSCLKYGNYSFLGKGKSGTSGSVSEAYKYYEKGCSLNEPDSCLHSGLILVSRSMKEEVNRDVKKGVQLLTKSCEMNNGTACFYLSGLHIAGIHADPDKEISVELSTQRDPKEFVLPKDMSKAFSYATKACDLRNMYACANLSQMYARGDGTEKSEEKAEKYKRLAMEMQDEVKKQQQTLGFQQ
ncbi:cytochrome c oxidase assembly factor 7 homolog [Bradysia coprophila]|uniref:cytochrome c oxidase assembly factor 7 homolog n=1 Tax=Bradysia coprophila TaxID=38358 RepID=UPI00187DA2C1|nr:cytochrome c oxidase assembly factor 7 homolog [Bradysia coprophila]